MIWGLVSKKYGPPTVKNLNVGLGIAHGIPFAYESGIASSVSYGPGLTITTVGGLSYTLPPFTNPLAHGTVVNKFDLLVRGFNLHDWVSNYSFISNYASHPWQIRKTLKIRIESPLIQCPYKLSYFNTYASGIIPAQFFFGTVQKTDWYDQVDNWEESEAVVAASAGYTLTAPLAAHNDIIIHNEPNEITWALTYE
jgi:hypothetical protein